MELCVAECAHVLHVNDMPWHCFATKEKAPSVAVSCEGPLAREGRGPPKLNPSIAHFQANIIPANITGYTVSLYSSYIKPCHMRCTLHVCTAFQVQVTHTSDTYTRHTV